MSSPEPPRGMPDDGGVPNPPIDPVSRGDLLTEQIARLLVDASPQAWRRLDLIATMTVEVVDVRFTVIMEDGSTPEVELPGEVNEALVDLRREMYEKGRGTWFSTRITIDPPGEYHVNFNFELEPVCDPPIPTSAIVRDLDHFPRERSHVPPWLKKKIDEYHEALYAQYDSTNRSEQGD